MEEQLKSFGAVDPQELLNSQNRRSEISKTKAEMEVKLTEAWELAMPVALLGGYRRDLHGYLIQEEKRRDWNNGRATVEPKIPQVKSDVFEGVPSEFALAADYQAFYADRLDKALHRLFHPPPEGMSDSVFVTDRDRKSVV